MIKYRRSGRLGFEDIQMLLNGSLQPLNARHTLSIDGGEGRLHVDYRLDGQFDHWLLDEFQDTSSGQWQVIANLIDEVLQDTEGRRSLFYVGDVKQAIFGWREGDAALFDDIYQHYNDIHPGSIRKEHMEDSRRSGPALMESINRIFGEIPRLRTLFPEHPELAERWATAWAPHTTHHKDRKDYVELLTLAKEGEADLTAEERRLTVVTSLVKELAPHEKQLSCAILVRQNSTASALANVIRAHTDVPVTVETDTLIGMDHPVASSFLSLLQFASHPGDTVAWKHLCMTPAFSGKCVEGLRHPAPRSRPGNPCQDPRSWLPENLRRLARPAHLRRLLSRPVRRTPHRPTPSSGQRLRREGRPVNLGFSPLCPDGVNPGEPGCRSGSDHDHS